MEELDLAKRRLCPDGACIGVIGDNGKCRVCGLKADANPDEDPTWDGNDDEAETEAESETEAETETDAEADPDFADRRLCPDGACIGVIGADGLCKVCGRTGS